MKRFIYPRGVFNRPGVVGAVLESASSLIKSLSQPFPPNLQDIINHKPEKLSSWNFERMFTFHNMSHVVCHVSRVTCHMSCVMCHISRVTCHMWHVTCDISHFFFWQSGEVYPLRVCYQRGLPRLVYGILLCSMLNKAAKCIIIILLMIRDSMLLLLFLNSESNFLW